MHNYTINSSQKHTEQSHRNKPKRKEQNLKQRNSVCDVIPNPPLRRDPDLVLVNSRLRHRLFHSLVPIHLKPPQKPIKSTKKTLKTSDHKN